MTGAATVLAALREAGAGPLFANPGSTELPLLDALAAGGGPRLVLGPTEPAVTGMADGYAQASGGLGVACVHVQPGMANALSGVLNAARARVPMLVLVGQQVQSLLPGDPFLGGEVVGMARPVAKRAEEVARAADLPAALARAMATALTPPCGPVVLSLPLDVQVAPAGPPLPVPPVAAPAPGEGALDRAAAVLREARSPVVLAGDGVAHAGAGDALGALAARLGAPVFGEPMAARVPLATDHPLWRGPLPPFAGAIGEVLAPHDVVLAVGMPVFRVFGWSPGTALPPGARLVHVEVDPAEVGRSHAPEAGVVGDVAAALAGLLARLGPPDDAAAARRAHAVAGTAGARRQARRALAAAASGPGVSPGALCRALAGAVGPRDLVVDEALTSTRLLRTALGRRAPGTWLAHRGSALGWGLPAAVGAAMAAPGRRVMCVHGDGSLMFGLPALWTAAHERVPLALVVADNGGYEILRAGLEGLTGRPEDAWPGLWLREPALDWVALCRGMGADAERLARPADLREALAGLWRRAAAGPAVLVVPVTGRTPPVGHPIPAPPRVRA